MTGRWTVFKCRHMTPTIVEALNERREKGSPSMVREFQTTATELCSLTSVTCALEHDRCVISQKSSNSHGLLYVLEIVQLEVMCRVTHSNVPEEYTCQSDCLPSPGRDYTARNGSQTPPPRRNGSLRENFKCWA